MFRCFWDKALSVFHRLLTHLDGLVVRGML